LATVQTPVGGADHDSMLSGDGGRPVLVETAEYGPRLDWLRQERSRQEQLHRQRVPAVRS
jgi:hypothetical protein